MQSCLICCCFQLRACVSLATKNRIIGNAAKSQVRSSMMHIYIPKSDVIKILIIFKFQIITNFKNTVHGFKKFHGRTFDDPFVQAEIPKLPYSLHKMANGSAGIKVNFSAKPFSPQTPPPVLRREQPSDACSLRCPNNVATAGAVFGRQ